MSHNCPMARIAITSAQGTESRPSGINAPSKQHRTGTAFGIEFTQLRHRLLHDLATMTHRTHQWASTRASCRFCVDSYDEGTCR